MMKIRDRIERLEAGRPDELARLAQTELDAAEFRRRLIDLGNRTPTRDLTPSERAGLDAYLADVRARFSCRG